MANWDRNKTKGVSNKPGTKSIFGLIMASAINTVNKAEFKDEMLGSFKKFRHIFLIIFYKNMYKRNNTP